MANLEWIDAMQQQVEGACLRHGWTWDDGQGYERWSRSSMGSRYATLQRRQEFVDGDGDEIEQYQTVKVRIGDHSTAYCSEDISLVPEQGGDDHSFADLEAILSGPFVETR